MSCQGHSHSSAGCLLSALMGLVSYWADLPGLQAHRGPHRGGAEQPAQAAHGGAVQHHHPCAQTLRLQAPLPPGEEWHEAHLPMPCNLNVNCTWCSPLAALPAGVTAAAGEPRQGWRTVGRHHCRRRRLLQVPLLSLAPPGYCPDCWRADRGTMRGRTVAGVEMPCCGRAGARMRRTRSRCDRRCCWTSTRGRAAGA